MTRPSLLQLGEDLALPLELVTRRTAVVGQTDTGKTSTAVVLVEEARKRGVQVVVIDPSGAWWGVTSSASGKGPGLDMVVLGGEHGEIPLNDSAGRPVARLVAQHGASPVLDLDRPHFRSWAGRQRFVADFLAELYEVVRGHVLIVIDEAHRFAPQAVRDEGGDVARCLGAVVDAVALGRRRGLSVVVITQRLAKLHKDVLELCEIMFAHRLRGNNDLAQLRGWVEGAGARRMLDALRRYPSLSRAELSTLALTFGGSMRNNLSALRAAGLIDEAGGRVALTATGQQENPPAPPYTTDEIIKAHLAQTGKAALVAGARRVLDVVLRSPDRGYTRSELERLANSAGGSFRNNLSALRRRGLVEERNRRVYPSHTLYADRIAP